MHWTDTSFDSEPLLTLLAHCLNPIILNTLIDLGAVNPGTKRIQVVQEQDVQRRYEFFKSPLRRRSRRLALLAQSRLQ